jgi:hypothetical protein
LTREAGRVPKAFIRRVTSNHISNKKNLTSWGKATYLLDIWQSMDYSLSMWERSHNKGRLVAALSVIFEYDIGEDRISCPIISYYLLIYGSAPAGVYEYGEG